MISTLEDIKVSGIDYPVYSMDFSRGSSNEPGSVSIDFVNSSGEYLPPKLNTSSLMSISVGDFFKFNGFAVSYSISNRVPGKVMTVKFVDESIILDKYFVGLKGKNGAGFETEARGSFSNVILVGQKVDPFSEILPENFYDPLSPCRKNDGSYRKEILDLKQHYQEKILEVVYSFDELLGKLKTIIKVNNLPNSVNFKYFASHTGSIRSVLTNWCNDYGFDFFWEDGSITFYDLKVGININDANLAEDCAILTKDVGESIEDNKAMGSIVYFGKEGGVTNYDCSEGGARKLVLRPLTIQDIFYTRQATDKGAIGSVNFGDNPQLDPTISKYYKKNGESDLDAINRFEAMSVLSYYSRELRDLYVYYYFEGLTTPQLAEARINQAPIKLMGNMTIKGVLYPNAASLDSQYTYERIISTMTEQSFTEFQKNNGYFIAVKRNNLLHTKFQDLEEGISKDFMGQYWIRYYTDPQKNKPSISAPDGSAKYFTSGEEFNLPFIKLLPSSTKNAKNIFSDIMGTRPDGTTEANDNFVLLDRPAAFYPPENSPKLDNFLSDIEKIEIKELGEDDVGEYLTEVGADSFLVVYSKPAKFEIKSPVKDVINPEDQENVNVSIETGGIITPYGLRSARCKSYKVKTDTSAIEIFTPSQSYDDGISHGGYAVLINQEAFPTIVRRAKIEKVLGNVHEDDQSLGVDILIKDITQDSFKILKYHRDEDTAYTPNKQEYNKEAIDKIMDDFSTGLNFAQQINKISISYVLSGFPKTRKKTSDGLESFSLRYSGSSEGMKTYLTFSNKFKLPKTERMVLKNIENNNINLGIRSKKPLPSSESIAKKNTPVSINEIL